MRRRKKIKLKELKKTIHHIVSYNLISYDPITNSFKYTN